MQVKVLVALFSGFLMFQTSFAQRCRPPILPPPLPSTVVVMQTEASKDCGYISKRGRCFDELILPPIRAELPQGLGYFPSAVPLVASCYSPAVEVGGVCCGASVPVTSPYTCLTLAAPLCPDLAPLVRPIIL